MKRFFIAALILCAAATTTLNAQALKFGHINSAELLASLPEVKEADKQLQEYGGQLENQLKTMTAEYQTKMQAYQSGQAMMADAVKQMKEKEIIDLQQRIQEFQQTAQESVEKKKEELYAPILKKAEDAIIAIAKESGYAYVFDTSVGSVIYGQESDNLMSVVKKRLGVTDPAPAAKPAVAPIKK